MYEAWFDASVKRKKASIGGVIRRNGTVIATFTKEIPYGASSCRAEYIAFIELILLIQKLGIPEVTIYGDAMVVVTQVKQYIPVREDKPLYRYHKSALKLLQRIPNWRLSWVPRRENKFADGLSRGESRTLITA